jgi:hypothetical protein
VSRPLVNSTFTEDHVTELLQELDLINRLHNTAANYEKSLALLRSLKAGAVKLEQVNLIADGWNLAQPMPTGGQAVPVDVVVEKEASAPSPNESPQQ